MWKPATIDEVEHIVQNDLKACDAEQLEVFHLYDVESYVAPIVRYGLHERVIVVARKEDEVIYWEDVEEGFNVSPIDAYGVILEHYCNQDQLNCALNYWISGRVPTEKFGPGQPIS